MPPSRSPNAPPPAAIALHTPSAFVRSSPSANVVVMIDSAAGDDERAAEALQAAGGHEPRVRGGEPVEQRGEREDRDAEQEQPPAPEEVAGPAAEQQEAAEHQRVAVDDPLQVRRREPEVASGSTAARRSPPSRRGSTMNWARQTMTRTSQRLASPSPAPEAGGSANSSVRAEAAVDTTTSGTERELGIGADRGGSAAERSKRERAAGYGCPPSSVVPSRTLSSSRVLRLW